MVKKIALAADHAGYEEKEKLKKTLDELGISYEDFGTVSTDSVDYPDYAQAAADPEAFVARMPEEERRFMTEIPLATSGPWPDAERKTLRAALAEADRRVGRSA